MRKNLQLLIASMVVLIASSAGLYAAVPKGWFMAGSRPNAYAADIDPEVIYDDHPAAYLRSVRPDLCRDDPQSTSDKNDCNAFGTMMQSLVAEQYLGKRIRFRAYVRSEGLDEWAGLWMRLDKGKDTVAFDNMQNRAIRGSSAWQKYEIVLDVPADATGVSFGILLAGHGEIWISGVQFETVGVDVPLTGQAQTGPVNLGFEK